jgi:hypothetical protein
MRSVATFPFFRAILWGLAASFLIGARAGEPLVHGVWVWKTPSALELPGSAEALRDFCKANEINEVYLSFSRKPSAADKSRVTGLIEQLHQASIRVEALLGSANADKPGLPRDELVAQVREILQFNQKHPKTRFDGIHLDIEPHQRAENKGPGNLTFLPNLVAAYRAVMAVAEPAKLTVNADIPNKYLKGDLAQRQMLLSSVPRVTLMLYELSSPKDGKSNPEKIQKLHQAADKYLRIAYEGLDDPKLAKMAIALRTPDYGGFLPDILNTLDSEFSKNPHYLGWARHSYNNH